MCDYLRLIITTHFLLCKYFAAISVASSLQVTLQSYFQIFYSTAPNTVAIIITKIKKTNCQAKGSREYKIISNKNTFSGRNHRSMFL